jgi:hypothetical protein
MLPPNTRADPYVPLKFVYSQVLFHPSWWMASPGDKSALGLRRELLVSFEMGIRERFPLSAHFRTFAQKSSRFHRESPRKQISNKTSISPRIYETGFRSNSWPGSGSSVTWVINVYNRTNRYPTLPANLISLHVLIHVQFSKMRERGLGV